MTMRLHRFFVGQQLPAKGPVKIKNDDLVHQWRHVLRFQVGQEVVLFDNSGKEFKATITSLGNREAELEVATCRVVSFEPKIVVTLFLSLAKRDSFEWTLEKGTELGVARFVPVISERSEKKKVNLERSKVILKEASEQSGRVILPEIAEPISLTKILENPPANSFVLDPAGRPFSEAGHQSDGKVNVFIGPEGGFSKSEIELFKNRNVPIFSLGPQILRAETAAVAIASLLLLEK